MAVICATSDVRSSQALFGYLKWQTVVEALGWPKWVQCLLVTQECLDMHTKVMRGEGRGGKSNAHNYSLVFELLISVIWWFPSNQVHKLQHVLLTHNAAKMVLIEQAPNYTSGMCSLFTRCCWDCKLWNSPPGNQSGKALAKSVQSYAFQPLPLRNYAPKTFCSLHNMSELTSQLSACSEPCIPVELHLHPATHGVSHPVEQNRKLN